MWTDEQLARLQNINCDRDHTHEMDRKMSELYRLCRLGLAAEQVGRETLAKHGEDVPVTANEQRAMDAFVLHEAWRK